MMIEVVFYLPICYPPTQTSHGIIRKYKSYLPASHPDA